MQTDGRWQNGTSPSPRRQKPPAPGWAGRRMPRSLRVQSQQVFDSAMPPATSWKAITPSILSVVTRCRWGKLTFSIENLLNEDYVTIWGQRARCLYSPTYGSSSLYASTKVVAAPLV
ncbi:hypothetical protein LNP74_24380 [Klebsiella pneumoniae subsp. pneumoniae]|nr:hypothetical protein [Klebsiella pneumoniae subsp. pneumoniae]